MKSRSLPRTLAATLLLTGASLSHAATLHVTVTQDDYDGVCDQHCSLRDAIAVANQSGTANTILLAAGSYGLSRLDALGEDGLPLDDDDNLTGDLDITGVLTIKGSGANASRIDGLSTDPLVVRHRLFEVRPEASLTLEYLTLTGGNSANNGGAVENHGSLSLRYARLQDNQTRNDQQDTPERGRGGAIASYGDLQVLGTHFQLNAAIGSDLAFGGVIYNLGSLLIDDSRFIDNRTEALSGPGAVLYSKGHAEVLNSLFYDNAAPQQTEDGALTNQGGELVLSNSTISRTQGGTLSNGRQDAELGEHSKLTLANVTVTRNVAGNGQAALENWGELAIDNSIVAGNRDLNAPATPNNCQNRGELFSYQALGLLRNDEESNCSADLFINWQETFTQVLSPSLTRHGQTWTHDLLPNSPAIDAAVTDCQAYDQRGVARPQDGDGDGVAVCDLGAYELIP